MKRRSETTDSFDLLLDAVTNAFGGILFLAILLILLVNRQASGVRHNEVPVDSLQPLARANEVRELRSRIALFEAAIQAQQDSLENLTRSDLEGDYARVAELQNLLSQLQASREQHLVRNQSLVDELERLQQHGHELRYKIDSEGDKKAELEQELAKRKLPQIRTARTPRLRETRKREFPILLRYGRVYRPYLLEGNRNARQFNSDDFVMLSNSFNLTSVTPKPYRGQVVEDSEVFIESLATAFEHLHKDLDYIAIATWADSFKEFNELRNAIVAAGFEYRIIPVESGGFIQEGAVGQPFVQ